MTADNKCKNCGFFRGSHYGGSTGTNMLWCPNEKKEYSPKAGHGFYVDPEQKNQPIHPAVECGTCGHPYGAHQGEHCPDYSLKTLQGPVEAWKLPTPTYALVLDSIGTVLADGDIYEIKVLSRLFYQVISARGRGNYESNRFQIVRPRPGYKAPKVASQTTNVKPNDHDALMDFFSAPMDSSHCKCGLLRKQCQYHNQS